MTDAYQESAYGQVDGSGAAARFHYPHGVAVDNQGVVYVADTFNSTIRLISPWGDVLTLAGLARVTGTVDGKGNAARFFEPYGLTVDGTGTVYVADVSNQTIRTIAPGGVVSTLAGQAGIKGTADGVGTKAQFSVPADVAVDKTGNVYVMDAGNGTIRVIAPGGAVTTLAGKAGVSGSADGLGSAARFVTPYGITIDPAGHIYVADSRNDTVRQVTPAGMVTTLAEAWRRTPAVETD